MKATHTAALAAACVLAAGLGAYAYGPEPAWCPALQARHFTVEPHEADVRWIVADGAPCRLRFAINAPSSRTEDIRYEIYQQPKTGHVSIDPLGVVFEAPADILSETFGLAANIPGRDPVRSVLVVGRRT
jgi:hypothetical protein